jgi:hypothetical protein
LFLIPFFLFAPVLVLYSQGGGKSGAHSWQASTQNIGAVSYISMQLYEAAFQSTFWAIHQGIATLQALTFNHASPDHFLQLLPGHHSLSPDLRYLELTGATYAVYSHLQDLSPKLVQVVADLQRKCRMANSKKKSTNHSDEVDSE